MNAAKIGDVSGTKAMDGRETGEIVADKVDFRREILFASEPQLPRLVFRHPSSGSNPMTDRAKGRGADAGSILTTSVALVAEHGSILPVPRALYPNFERLSRPNSPQSGNHLESIGWHLYGPALQEHAGTLGPRFRLAGRDPGSDSCRDLHERLAEGTVRE